MNDILEKLRSDKLLSRSIVYSIVSLVIYAILNYYSNSIFSSGWLGNIIIISIWISFYFPLLFFVNKSKWEMKDFGLTLNIKTILVCLVIIVLHLALGGIRQAHLFTPLKLTFEAFARTGEELFMRGFVYFVLFKLFSKRNNPAFWAIILSSLLFTLVHTQPDRTIGSFSLFTSTVLGFAIPRWLTGSILPSVIIHLLFNSSLLGAMIGVGITLILILIAKLRGENAINLSVKVPSKSKSGTY